MMRRLVPVALALLASACASQRLSGGELDRVTRPAFISRIEEQAGPRSLVFRADGAYREKLKKLEPREADRRLQAKLVKAMTRFEISERLRGKTLQQLPRGQPWTRTVPAVQVATRLESFLVEEVPANAPDYDLLVPLRADAVVEFVIQDYGMRSEGGRAGVFMEGYGRMFWLKGRGEVWRMPFRLDRVSEQAPHLDPFKVGKDPELFREEMTGLLDTLSARFSEELNPPDRRGAVSSEEAVETAPDALPGPDTRTPTRIPRADELAPGELPDPD